MIKNLLKQFLKVLPEISISAALIYFYLSGAYLTLPHSLDLAMLKATLVSLGFIHATLINKIAFPAIDWANADADKSDKIRAIVLYGVIIYAYALGG